MHDCDLFLWLQCGLVGGVNGCCGVSCSCEQGPEGIKEENVFMR